MKKQSEYETRRKAIQLYEDGVGFEDVLRVVHRSRGWLSKWLRRFKEEGAKGLHDHSRAPKRIWKRTHIGVAGRILAVRKELESHRSRRSHFSGVGAEAIHWEFEQRGFKRIPSIPTIARILARHGKTKKKRSGSVRNGNKQPYPYVPANRMGDFHQTDLVGPRYLRGPRGVVRFYSFHTLDVAGHTASISQYGDKRTLSLCRHLVASWRCMGVPAVSQLDNEMAATGGGRYRHSISNVIRLHMLLGVHLVFIPPGEPGRNAAVESFNHLWQERVLRRHTCPSLAKLRDTSRRFMDYYHDRKPHRALTQKEHGTRFPGILRTKCWRSLRHLPKRFDLDRFLDGQGQFQLPLAKGEVSFVRKVDTHGRIEVNGASYFIRRKLEGQYVVATIVTHCHKLVIVQERKIIKTFRFPHGERTVEPMLRRAKTRLWR